MKEYANIRWFDDNSYQIVEIKNEDELFQQFSKNPLLDDRSFLTEEFLGEHNFYPVADEIDEQIYDPLKQQLILKPFSEWVYNPQQHKIYKQYFSKDLTFNEKKQIIIQELAKLRYEKETAGVVIDEINIATDRASQIMINATLTILKKDLSRSINWKGLYNEWLVVDYNKMLFISECVADYVEKCFNNEHGINQWINSVSDNDWDELAKVDINAGWPDPIYSSQG